MAHVVTLGESMGLVRGAGIGSFTQIGSAEIDTGGAEGNVAIGLARLGVDVSWLGRVGDDSIGRRVIRDLRGEGVDVHAIVDEAAATGLMLKETPRAGSTVVSYYRAGSAGSRLTPSDLAGIELEHARLLHVTGVTLAISDSARATVFAAIERARAAGVRVSFDVNHRSRLWSTETARPVLREATALADILFAGDDEAAIVLDAETPPCLEETAEALASLGPREVVLKHGAAGASAWLEGVLTSAPAVAVPVVDTVGAGDAFVAGYLSELLAEAPTEKRLGTATRTGAFACRHPGDWQGAARLAELAHLEADPVTR
ncbi:sugar kinase [Microbacterium sp. 4R-513]|uniref:sugar kinase n=1 Tax=Microbacterium sp. 4R-513 TaxID=2567934 RepID=UPI0013E0FC26|nr:sugar kinase [Microbacterium sp. 4R-513]QIG39411.1 sugar kinase [Microbacterium sp. 4R-513]